MLGCIIKLLSNVHIMKLFKKEGYTFKMHQVALFKVYLLSIGLLLGTYFVDFFTDIRTIVWIVFAVLMVYFVYLMAVDNF